MSSSSLLDEVETLAENIGEDEVDRVLALATVALERYASRYNVQLAQDDEAPIIISEDVVRTPSGEYQFVSPVCDVVMGSFGASARTVDEVARVCCTDTRASSTCDTTPTGARIGIPTTAQSGAVQRLVDGVSPHLLCCETTNRSPLGDRGRESVGDYGQRPSVQVPASHVSRISQQGSPGPPHAAWHMSDALHPPSKHRRG